MQKNVTCLTYDTNIKCGYDELKGQSAIEFLKRTDYSNDETRPLIGSCKHIDEFNNFSKEQHEKVIEFLNKNPNKTLIEACRKIKKPIKNKKGGYIKKNKSKKIKIKTRKRKTRKIKTRKRK